MKIMMKYYFFLLRVQLFSYSVIQLLKKMYLCRHKVVEKCSKNRDLKTD